MVYAARVGEMLWERGRDRQHQKITLLIGRTFLSNVRDMLQSAQKQKLDAGISVKSITGNITTTMLHLFILPIRVFFLIDFVAWFRKRRTKSIATRDGHSRCRWCNSTTCPRRWDWASEQNEIPSFL